MTDRTADPSGLDAVAELYRAALPPGEVEEFPVRGMDEVACAVWSVTLHPEQGSPAPVGTATATPRRRRGSGRWGR
jgi:hypothetical protein